MFELASLNGGRQACLMLVAVQHMKAAMKLSALPSCTSYRRMQPWQSAICFRSLVSNFVVLRKLPFHYLTLLRVAIYVQG